MLNPLQNGLIFGELTGGTASAANTKGFSNMLHSLTEKPYELTMSCAPYHPAFPQTDRQLCPPTTALWVQQTSTRPSRETAWCETVGLLSVKGREGRIQKVMRILNKQLCEMMDHDPC